MKKFFYLFLTFLSFHTSSAQNSKQSDPAPMTESSVIEKLDSLAKNQNTIGLKQQEVLLLQLKAESEKRGYERGILESGEFLMVLYLNQSKNKEVVELGNQLKKIAQNQRKDPSGRISNMYRTCGLALSYLGLDDAGKKDVETAITYVGTIKDADRKQLRLTQCYMDLFSYYNSRKNQSDKKIYKDSTLYYLQEALKAGKKISDNSGQISRYIKYNEIESIYMRLGIFYLEYPATKGNLELAEKNLLEAQKIYENKDYNIPPALGKTILLNQLSWLYLEKKEYKKSIDFANRALELEKLYKRPTARVESFEFLATCYAEIGEKEKAAFYMRKYTSLKDSLNTANRLNADTTMKEMIAEVDDSHKKNTEKQLIYISVLALVAATAICILWIRKSRIMRRKYEQIIHQLKNESVSNPVKINNNESEHPGNKKFITDKTEQKILTNLEGFEQSDIFLENSITIGALASRFETNPRYLSDIIKKHKFQNFNNYINGLRVNYIVHKLYHEPIYRGYKIAYLAQECGFSSLQAFIPAFRKIVGVTPFYFIQNLKGEENNTM
ncbi:AraC-like DNA-binding protein [Chryseobacterium defluvii]|uniref:AraC-like DNA-binding protein n=1 Tax=Chryseobacterium defluvii TaxID=160396 RepID=A0A840KDN0_9FLAO|nr:helix-turn-helix domain-containing protein [Chryseobacterium defluvii]MBB4805874.1 AraC-like DNA-binding protein [Chryseobacterium defluvii]